jgi:ketosteroid isomerase-like protein
MTSPISIEDRLAIRELQDRYAEAVFRYDAVAYAATWTADAHWEILDHKVDGIADILALWKKFMDDMDTVVMNVTGGTIDIQGDTGTGRWYILDVNRTKDRRELIISSAYDDVYQRDEKGQWRFKSRKLQLFLASRLQPVEIPG